MNPPLYSPWDYMVTRPKVAGSLPPMDREQFDCELSVLLASAYMVARRRRAGDTKENNTVGEPRKERSDDLHGACNGISDAQKHSRSPWPSGRF